MLKAIILFLLLSINYSSYSQNLSGTWKGSFTKNLLIASPNKLMVELNISNDSIVDGISHYYYKNNNYEHYNLKGVFHIHDSIVIFKEVSTIAVKLGLMQSNCMGTYTMKLSDRDSFLVMDGKWKDNSRGLVKCPTIKVKFEKKKVALIPKPVLKIDSTLAESKKLLRKPDIQHIIEYSESEMDSVKIEVYDNGTIDQDTVSVYLNDLPVISNKMISTTPLTFYVNLNRTGGFDKIRLIAESLGTIPPCTALMVVTTSRKRYEVNLSSTLESNGVVEFFLKE